MFSEVKNYSGENTAELHIVNGEGLIVIWDLENFETEEHCLLSWVAVRPIDGVDVSVFFPLFFCGSCR